MTIKRILCVDKENTCQSVIMEALFKKAVQEAIAKRRNPDYDIAEGIICDLTFESAASSSETISPATKLTIRCLRERSIQISNHKSHPISGVDIDKFDLIICLDSNDITCIGTLHPRGLIILAGNGEFSRILYNLDEYHQHLVLIEAYVQGFLKFLLR